jgi:hypothetical protein
MPDGHYINIIRYSRMRRRKHILQDYLRRKRHILYVEKRVVELRGDICQQAVLYGTVDAKTRDFYLKYNGYLVKLVTIM